MKSKEDIIKGLRCQTGTETVRLSCSVCPYSEADTCDRDIMLDAIEFIEVCQDRIPTSWKESVMASFMKGE